MIKVRDWILYYVLSMIKFLIREIKSQVSTNIFVGLLILSSVSCRSNLRKLPIDTSFGKLVSVEIKKSIHTDEKKINPKPGEVVYLLTFAAGDTIPFNTYFPSRDIRKAFPAILETIRLKAPLIIDMKTNTQYIPVFIGMKDHTQKIIPSIAWGINSEFKNLTWSGTLTASVAMTLVYILPEEARRITFKDHEHEFRIR